MIIIYQARDLSCVVYQGSSFCQELSYSVSFLPQIRRLGIPWGAEECEEEVTAPDYYTVSSVYTKDACQMECYLRAIRSRCDCDWTGTHGKLTGIKITSNLIVT